MNHCTNCGADFEGNFCPNCGKEVQNTLGKLILRLLPAALLAVFSVLMLGLYAAPAYGDDLLAFTIYDHVSLPKEMVDPVFYGCTVSLILFAVVGFCYASVEALLGRRIPLLRFGGFLCAYLPIALIDCIMMGKVAQSIAPQAIQAGLICLLIFPVLFAAGQAVSLVILHKTGDDIGIAALAVIFNNIAASFKKNGQLFFRFVPTALLLVFTVLMLGLYAAPAYGEEMLSFTVYDHIDLKELAEPIFYNCAAALIAFAVVGFVFSLALLFTSRAYSVLQYGAFVFYLPIFICASIMAGKVGNASLLQGGLIAAIVLSVVFAAAQIGVLVARYKLDEEEGFPVAKINKPYKPQKPSKRVSLKKPVKPTKPAKPYVIAQYPYPAPPKPKDYSKQELAVYYNETLPQFNKAVELMKEHHPEYVAAYRAAMDEYRNTTVPAYRDSQVRYREALREYRVQSRQEYRKKCDDYRKKCDNYRNEMRRFRKNVREERKRLLCALYEKKHNAACTYPLAYIWWNFSF